MADTEPHTRSLMATTLAIIWPGLGHAYLRSWLWSAAWFFLSLVAMGAALQEAVADPSNLESIWTLLEALFRDTSWVWIVTHQVIIVVNAVHVYTLGRMAERRRATQAAAESGDAEGDGPAPEPDRCPSCGGPLDEEIDFCHWCTHELDGTDAAD